jgi:hypothetical protein
VLANLSPGLTTFEMKYKTTGTGGNTSIFAKPTPRRARSVTAPQMQLTGRTRGQLLHN